MRESHPYDDTGCPLNVVDVTSDQRVAAAGSTNSLLLFRISRDTEDIYLEEVHSIRDTSRMSSLKPILDLRFNPTLALPQLLASTSSAGALVIWDITHAKTSMGQWQPAHILAGHSGSVNCVTWHYSNAHTLISGSHDTKVKLWDIRVRTGATLSLCPAKGCAVRAVQFRKTEGADKFAVALTNGNIQIWDIRHPKLAERTFKAHDIAYTLDWNSELPDMLVSGGRDGFVQVWDTSQVIDSERAVSYKPTYSIETAEGPVIRAKWRPGHPYQVASSSGRSSQVDVWSVLRPNVPLASFDMGGGPDAVGTGFVWLDQYLKPDDVMGSALNDTQWWEWDQDESSDEPPAKLFSRLENDSLTARMEVGANHFDQFESHSIAESSVMAFDEGARERKIELQRQRFRCFKHKHRGTEESKHGFGFMLGCTKQGHISINQLQHAMRPMETFRPYALDLSFRGRIASIVSKNAVSEMENEMVHFQTSPPVADASQPKLHSARVHDEIIDMDLMIEFAKRYITPGLLPETKFTANVIQYCCDYNAKVCEDFGAIRLGKVWRLLALFYTPVVDRSKCLVTSDSEISESSLLSTSSPRNTGRRASVDFGILTPSTPRSEDNAHITNSPGRRRRTFSAQLDLGENSYSPSPTSQKTLRRPKTARDLTTITADQLFITTASPEVADDYSDASSVDSSIVLKAYDSVDAATTIDISAWDLSDQFHSEASLWLGSSLNILYRLSMLAPLEESEIQFHAPFLDRDRLEMTQAICLAKPVEFSVRPEVEGERKQRRLQRRQRRDQYVHFNRKLYGSSNHACEDSKHPDRRSLSSPHVGGFGPLTRVHFKCQIIHTILRYHAEIGDVQTCSTILLVMGSLLEPAVDDFLQRKWLCSYIDLLHRAQEFSIAAKIVSICGNSDVEKSYQTSSRIAEGCLTCSTASAKKGIVTINPKFKGYCESCSGVISRCAVCELKVRGVYVWCQGCGHGGHLSHMNEWFKTENVCPTGCGHVCRS